MERKYDLEERLIVFAAQMIDVSEALPKTFAGVHLGNQLLRSRTSPALHSVKHKLQRAATTLFINESLPERTS